MYGCAITSSDTSCSFGVSHSTFVFGSDFSGAAVSPTAFLLSFAVFDSLIVPPEDDPTTPPLTARRSLAHAAPNRRPRFEPHPPRPHHAMPHGTASTHQSANVASGRH